ncbi:MAG: hypothetical protein WC480_02920 [Patescibacteria group bacterium]
MQCKNCNQQFTIYPEDKEFYGKIGVPEPKLCPLCRQQRRLAWRNERIFYQRNSDLSGKNILSTYSTDKPFPVYEQEEWWSDDWDPFNYGREIDWQRPILDQIMELFNQVPRPALFNSNNVNSYYGNLQEGNSNCYMEVGSGWSEACFYGTINVHCKDIVDSHYCHKCEVSYSLINCDNCYHCVNCQDCHNNIDCYFCFNCRGCNNCFGCVGLRNAKYCWLNEQIAPEEFNRRLENSGKYSYFSELKNKFSQFKKEQIHVYSILIKCERSTGDHLTYCTNVKHGFDLVEAVNCAYFFCGEKITDSYDCDVAGWPASWLYEIVGADTSSHMVFSAFCWHNNFLQYCHSCFGCQDIFGCFALHNRKFCILNKQYSEEEYKRLLPKIIDKMKADGDYGEFFPVKFSPYAYNETVAQEYYPLTREEVLKRGWKWQDNLPSTKGKETIKAEDLADDIKDIKAEITKEILVCLTCGRNYKVIPQEVDFYQKMNLPLPRQCPYCRHMERIHLRNPRRLYSRQCMCDNIKHGHASNASRSDAGRCANQFETPYAPDREELVYCQECYEKEIY